MNVNVNVKELQKKFQGKSVAQSPDEFYTKVILANEQEKKAKQEAIEYMYQKQRPKKRSSISIALSIKNHHRESFVTFDDEDVNPFLPSSNHQFKEKDHFSKKEAAVLIHINITKLQNDTFKGYFERLCGYLENEQHKTYWILCAEKIRISIRQETIQDAIDAGVVKVMSSFLVAATTTTTTTTTNIDDGLLFEAAWALTNISSGDSLHTKSVSSIEIIKSLVKLQKHQNPLIVWQCAWVLGNISGDSMELRDLVLREEGLDAICFSIENHPNNLNIVRNAAWTISNILRWKPFPKKEKLSKAKSVIISFLLKPQPDTETQIDSYWALSNLLSLLQEEKVLNINEQQQQEWREILPGTVFTSNNVDLIIPAMRCVISLIEMNVYILAFTPILSNNKSSNRCIDLALRAISLLVEKNQIISSETITLCVKLLPVKEFAAEALWILNNLLKKQDHPEAKQEIIRLRNRTNSCLFMLMKISYPLIIPKHVWIYILDLSGDIGTKLIL